MITAGPSLDNHCHEIRGIGSRLRLPSIISKARLLTTNVFHQAIIVVGLLLLFDTFPSANKEPATEIRTYNPASLL